MTTTLKLIELTLSQEIASAIYNGSREFNKPEVIFLPKEEIARIRLIAEKKEALTKMTFPEFINNDVEVKETTSGSQYAVFEVADTLLISDTQGHNYPKYTSILIANN